MSSTDIKRLGETRRQIFKYVHTEMGGDKQTHQLQVHMYMHIMSLYYIVLFILWPHPLTTPTNDMVQGVS